MSKAQCLDCEDILEPKHSNDFVKCKCGNSFLDGGDDYFRGGGNIRPLPNKEFYVALDRDEALKKFLLDVDIDDMFDDDSFLDDYDDYNLGYQAGTLDEREKILQGIQKLEDQSHATRTPLYQDIMFTKIRGIINGTA
jgi:hypothetical protein